MPSALEMCLTVAWTSTRLKKQTLTMSHISILRCYETDLRPNLSDTQRKHSHEVNKTYISCLVKEKGIYRPPDNHLKAQVEIAEKVSDTI